MPAHTNPHPKRGTQLTVSPSQPTQNHPPAAHADEVLAHGSGERPTAADLSHWLATGECPHDAITELCQRLTALIEHQVRPPLEIYEDLLIAGFTTIAITEIWDVYREAVDAGKDVRWPLAPLVNAWQQRPRPVEPNRRLTDRIIPARLAMADPNNNPRTLFSPAARVEYGPDGKQLVLPGFGNKTTPSPALPLALYDLGAGPTISPGRGAPLALRLFVEAILSVPMRERERGLPVAMSVALRELLQWLYPTRNPSPAEYWPRLMGAIEALDSWDARIPLYDPQTKRNELRRVVSVGGIPRGPRALDESVRIIVDLPPGSGNGPQVSDNLRLWGVKSAPAYRLLINLSYQWHKPGQTIIPLGKGKAKHWVHVSDPNRYNEISDDDIIALTFPSSTQKNRRVLLRRAKIVIATLQDANELRVIDGKILPPERR